MIIYLVLSYTVLILWFLYRLIRNDRGLIRYVVFAPIVAPIAALFIFAGFLEWLFKGVR